MSWNSDDLLTKARLYVERAYRSLDDSSVFALWSLLALELLARSAIANVHPVLLANPNSSKNLYFAIGREDLCEYPKSVPAKTVYDRCETLFRSFTKQEKDFCQALGELRNAEVHSGESVLEPIPVRDWQLKYYQVCEILLKTLNIDIDDYFPPEQIDSVKEILSINEKEERAAVRKLISAAKVQAKSDIFNIERCRDSLEHISPDDIDSIVENHAVACPVCGMRGRVVMKRLSLSDTRLVDDLPTKNITYIPTDFSCDKCRLSLEGYGRMVMAGLGEPVVVEVEVDLMDILMLYMEPDYGNE